jgi:hypothetical protein
VNEFESIHENLEEFRKIKNFDEEKKKQMEKGFYFLNI